MYLDTLQQTDAAGYTQYEISNVARTGQEVPAQPQILGRW